MSDFPTIEPDADDWDWMEIVWFDTVRELEGYEYAFDNYGPLFRRPELCALEDDMGGLRAFVDAHDEAREAWAEEIGWDRYSDLGNTHRDAHRAESAKRREEGGSS